MQAYSQVYRLKRVLKKASVAFSIEGKREEMSRETRGGKGFYASYDKRWNWRETNKGMVCRLDLVEGLKGGLLNLEGRGARGVLCE